ncbi:unnamed protein product [Phytophthora fragariaefolia]|uniref:Unnamed protein product n=1 Tax=Phytophthora fragariaefolia TaxID=1490495 RepID=A0A9W6XRA7_9STRA|nr:unnamed protein product [Phytophthora fragariaefolia]
MKPNFCREIPEFALKNDGAQRTWVSRFIKRYSTRETTVVEPIDNDLTATNMENVSSDRLELQISGSSHRSDAVANPISEAVIDSTAAAENRQTNDGRCNTVDLSTDISDATTEDPCRRYEFRSRKNLRPLTILKVATQGPKKETLGIPIFLDDLESMASGERVSVSIMDYCFAKFLAKTPLVLTTLSATFSEIKYAFDRRSNLNDGETPRVSRISQL